MNRRVLLLFVVMTVAADVSFAQDINLEYKFNKGDVWRYKTTISSQTVLEGKLTRSTVNITETFETHRIDSVYADGSAEVTLIQDSVFVTQNKKREKKDADEALIGQPIIYKMSKTGSLTIIRALERMTGKQKSSYENILKNLEKKKGLVPERSVKVGESWEFDVPISEHTPTVNWEGSLKTKFSFSGTMRRAGEERAIVRSSGTSKLYISGDQISGTLTGTSRGAMEFSLDAGREVEWFFETTADGDLSTSQGIVKVHLASGVESKLLR